MSVNVFHECSKWRGELEELEDTKGPVMTKSYAEAFDLLYGQDLC